ncbi:hypothetical protein ANANG_G00109340 [Anguilla anguilla]|uniref:G-protein coupled receptors family 2 profile 2 domain-containing protein n=1 Tax=Anguilla anguilla TaxID=7936 RepID=A0A9D3MK62_ANGAN|nr:hypothetical protein ANANG_G00109340 [Anguilla anguilla]
MRYLGILSASVSRQVLDQGHLEGHPNPLHHQCELLSGGCVRGPGDAEPGPADAPHAEGVGKKWITFLSIWGLSCLFGCTWGLGLLLLGPPSRVATFLFCIINSLQGFLLLVRYFMLEWIKKRKSDEEHQSTGSSVCP